VWLFGDQPKIETASIDAFFIGPRTTMITPWSTNAVEITQNMGISGILRIEEFESCSNDNEAFDPMLSQKYTALNQDIFVIDLEPESVQDITDIAAYNEQEGLALSDEEIAYLNDVSTKIKRPLTDSEVFGFSQVNSEHCRHKIFNGTFIIDGEEMPTSLFKLIKKTSAENPNTIISAYKDNVAFIGGPEVTQFAPKTADKPDFYREEPFRSTISLKAETHNFPTTVEPFNGAATGSGGEIRDRLAGGKGSLPLAGTAYDKVIMQAGGIGYGKLEQAQKDTPKAGDNIVILGGENYRIGMGGAAVSSADTGEFSSGIELNAIQRSNPEMQKRAANTIRGMVESTENTIVSIHDHGAGGHLNCLSELVEETGGHINLDALPVGDPTLSAKEIIGNESQERMGLVIGSENLDHLQRIADRERSPMYDVGKVTDNHAYL